MSAPVIPLSLAFASGIAALQIQRELPGYVFLRGITFFGVIAMALALVGGRWRLRPAWRLLVAIAFSICAGFVWAALRAEARLAERLPAALEGVDIVVEGRIARMPQEIEHGLRFPFEVERAPPAVPPRLLLAWYRDAKHPMPALHAGERWRLTVRLKRPHGSANPHGFDFEAWMLSEGLGASGYVRGAGFSERIDAGPQGLGDWIERRREAVRANFAKALPDSNWRGVLVALAIGDQHGVPAEQWTLFIRTGVVHLISISGLHVVVWSLIAGMLSGALWRRIPYYALRIPAKHVAVLAGFAAALGYCALAGWGVPAQRSLIMLGVVAWTVVGRRQIGTSSALAIALFLVLLRDPWAVFGRGFWLSFLAVALLLYAVGQRREAAWRGWVRAQWAVGIGLMPPLIALTGQVSLVAPLANAVAIPCVSFLLLPLVLLFALTGWAPLAQLAAFAFDLLARLLAILGSPQWAVWQQAAPPSLLIAAALLGALLLLLPRGVPGRYLGIALILPLVLWRAPRPLAGGFELTLLDVGQGLAAHVRTAKHDLLFDTGPSYGRQSDAGQRIVLPYLRGEGVRRLDGLIVSHQDSDHSGGAMSVLADVSANWLMGALPVDSALRKIATVQRECRRGDTWNWDGVRFEILHPAVATLVTRDGNTSSCVMRVSAAGTSVLLTADIPRKSERELLGTGLLRHDAVMTAPHHGSRTSSSAAFIEAISPTTVLIPVGYRSRFGHPHPEVLARYRAAGVEILRSDRDGAIRLTVGAQAPRWTRWREVAHRYWHTPWIETNAVID